MKTVRVFKLKEGNSSVLNDNFYFNTYYIGVEQRGSFIVKDEMGKPWDFPIVPNENSQPCDYYFETLFDLHLDYEYQIELFRKMLRGEL